MTTVKQKRIGRNCIGSRILNHTLSVYRGTLVMRDRPIIEIAQMWQEFAEVLSLFTLRNDVLLTL
jgi:hypothetical protein